MLPPRSIVYIVKFSMDGGSKRTYIGLLIREIKPKLKLCCRIFGQTKTKARKLFTQVQFSTQFYNYIITLIIQLCSSVSLIPCAA